LVLISAVSKVIFILGFESAKKPISVEIGFLF